MARKSRSLTDAQARAYIQGEEPFDAEEWERKHIDRLCTAVIERVTDGCAHLHRDNLLHTLNTYIKNHPQSEKLKSLVQIVENA